MKKLFVSILALAAFAACQSDFNNDLNLDAPQVGGNVSGGEHIIYAEVNVGEVTKATYGDELQALWEENDQIALLQEHADYGKTFSVVNKLNIKEGWGTSLAAFNGDISVDATSPRIYHIAYPVSAVSFNVSSELSKTSDTTYTMREDGLETAHYIATASFDYTYNATLNITVPTAQAGKWEPYMYTSTSEAVASSGIGAKTLTTLTGAVAIRAFEADGVTPKQLSKVVIVSSDAAIAGAFSGTATSTSTLGSVTGAETSDVYSTVSENDIAWYKGAKKGRAEADRLLLEKVQGMEPTSVTVTKAMSLAFAGTEKTISANNLENIAMDNEGFYTYYLNVAPATVGTLTIMATSLDGSTLIRSIDNQTFAASHRRGYMLKWEEATLSCGSVETWYDNYSSDPTFNLKASTIYVNGVSVEGVSADNVKTIGVNINGTLYEERSGVLSIEPVAISNLPSGKYVVYAYAKVVVNGQEKELVGGLSEVNVTTIPTLSLNVRTSFSNNSDVNVTNDIGGREMRVSGVALSDDYVTNNLVSSKQYKFIYGANNVIGTLGSNLATITAAPNLYNCCAIVVLDNGYICQSPSYSISVTGIPYYIDTTSANPIGWMANNTGVQDNTLLLKKSSASIVSNNLFYVPRNCNVTVTVRCAGYHGWGSSTNNLYINPTTSSVVTSGTAISVKGNQYYPGQAKWENKTQVCTLTTSANEISIYGTVKSSGMQGFTASIMVDEISVKY
jgi:hypothetical protein